jgi:ATP/maltotriose-dependent transcriptional regulator MalT
LAAGDEIGAARLVVQHRQAMLNSERWYVLEKWLSILPDTVIQQRSELLLAQAWIHYFHFSHALIPSILDVVESLLNNKAKEQPLYGESYLFKGVFCFFQGVIHFCRNELDMAIDCLGQAAELSYIIPRRASVGCPAGLALAYQAIQQTDKASKTLIRLYE